MKLKSFLLCGLFILSLLTRTSKANQPRYKLEIEYGRLKVLQHSLKFGSDGSDFDLIKDGGQENLYPHSRFTLYLRDKSQTIQFRLLYQGIFLNTFSKTSKPLKFDGEELATNTPLDVQYFFPFTRLTAFYKLFFNYSCRCR